MREFKLTLLLISIVLIFVGTSCSTKKKSIESEIYEELNQPTQSESSKEREILGFKITKKDNIKLYLEARKWINTPYSYGGTTSKGVDCSGLVMNIYLKVYNKKIHRNSAAIMKNNCKKIKIKDLEEGDLVFFSTRRGSKKITHVGIYLKDGKFLHASSSRGVIVSGLDSRYYKENFVCAGRVVR